ncbi:glycoside hydrolase superfamily [Chytriomyces sp. MP71]|nr:glycoside hydrolase superfamily [Chytriomyces sp. MP71]
MLLDLLLASFTLANTAAALALYEPADGKVMWGGWVDSENATATGNIGVGGDSPATFNQRLGKNAAVFHMSQSIPLAISPFDQTEETVPLKLIEDTNTDAVLFLTVYPPQYVAGSWDQVTDSDLLKLAYQLGNITDPTKSSRRVMLRYAPEMNGNWFYYAQQPTRFKTEWVRMWTAVRAVTKRVAFVWSPNASNGYPFGGKQVPNAQLGPLDSNGDGTLDNNDDPYTPYWPGDQYVDWVGMSVYWKGDPATGNPPHDNSLPPSDYWTQLVEGGGKFGGNKAYPFYTTWAKGKNLPLVMSEGGSAFAISQQGTSGTLPVGVGQLKIEQAFWQGYLNPTFFATYPKAKMFINFEYEKLNEDPALPTQNGVTRDYRITNDPTVLAAFQSDIAGLGNVLQWSSKFVAGLDPLTIGGGTSDTVPKSSGSAATTTAPSGGSALPVSMTTVTTSTKSAAAQMIAAGAAAIGAALLM